MNKQISYTYLLKGATGFKSTTFLPTLGAAKPYLTLTVHPRVETMNSTSMSTLQSRTQVDLTLPHVRLHSDEMWIPPTLMLGCAST